MKKTLSKFSNPIKVMEFSKMKKMLKTMSLREVAKNTGRSLSTIWFVSKSATLEDLHTKIAKKSKAARKSHKTMTATTTWKRPEAQPQEEVKKSESFWSKLFKWFS